jgi:hypothetical protein
MLCLQILESLTRLGIANVQSQTEGKFHREIGSQLTDSESPALWIIRKLLIHDLSAASF